MHIWQSKRVLKSGPHWQIPDWVKNRPKGVAQADWQQDVKEWKLSKLAVLNMLPKSRRAKVSREKSDE